MKTSTQLEEYLLQRTRSISKVEKTVSQEKTYLHEKQFSPLLSSIKDIEKGHEKTDKRVCEAIELLKEIESVLEELKI